MSSDGTEDKRRGQQSLFTKLGKITTIAVFLLILVGGIVRSTGSGMGCPDWPKCFGRWIPPTEVNELPDNYKQTYAQKRAVKNQRLARYLSFFGFHELSDKVKNDPSILEEADFNKYKTWIEYINRLIGAIIGVLIFFTCISSFSYMRKDPLITVLACLTLLLVVFQAWIGSIVVSTNLLPWMVTIHMLIALFIVMLLIYLVYRSSTASTYAVEIPRKRLINMVLIICVLSSLIQIVLGTQVRESVDVIAASFDFLMRDQWIEALGLDFHAHRSFAIFVFFIHVLLIFLIYKSGKKAYKLLTLSKTLLLLLLFEIIAGIILTYFSIPAFIQPIHLVLSTLIVAMQFWILLHVNCRISNQTLIIKNV